MLYYRSVSTIFQSVGFEFIWNSVACLYIVSGWTFYLRLVRWMRPDQIGLHSKEGPNVALLRHAEPWIHDGGTWNICCVPLQRDHEVRLKQTKTGVC